jgi:hypothetical protein
MLHTMLSLLGDTQQLNTEQAYVFLDPPRAPFHVDADE